MSEFEERECVFFKNEGQKIFGMIHRPLPLDTIKKAPAVLICHGFAGNKIGKHRIYVLLAERLAKEGIATLRMDFRGSGESEGSFSDMTVETEVSDALKGLEFLRNDVHIDASRIGLLGNSFGGLVATLAAQRDNHITSLALLAAVFDSRQWKKQWDTFLFNSHDPNASKHLSRELEGNIPGPKFFKEFFKIQLDTPLEALTNLPLLHIHSEIDERVNVEQAEEYKRCREEAKAETRIIRLKNSDHTFSNVDERDFVIEEIGRWFSKTL